MALTIRLNQEQEKNLQELSGIFGSNTASKTIIHMIMTHAELLKDLERSRLTIEELHETASDIAQAFYDRAEAEGKLKGLIKHP
ncbi:MAG: hypothetical protein GY941_08735 [Planctomycetes bacterium]|nr:hypothetical protein [Planctomycetota bacterium]